MNREIHIEGRTNTVSLNQPIIRYSGNPVMTAKEVNKVWTRPSLKTITCHNAGITLYNNSVVMLFRAHLRNGISVIGKALSRDGLTNWVIDPEPFLKPCGQGDEIEDYANREEIVENERGGVEDVRITEVDGTYHLFYSAYHGTEKNRVRIHHAWTRDFTRVRRCGPVMDIDMRNMVLFSERFNGSFAALFRPNDQTIDDTGGMYTQIQMGYSDTLEGSNWQLSGKPVMKQSGGPSSFSDKIGPGAPPLKTPHGWLNIFHGVRKTMDGNPYVLGVALHDLNDPEKIRVSNIPVLFPARVDCLTDIDAYVHVPQVVFSCGSLRKKDGTIYIYYGGYDTVMNVSFSHEDILAELCRIYPQDSQTGLPLYEM